MVSQPTAQGLGWSAGLVRLVLVCAAVVSLTLLASAASVTLSADLWPICCNTSSDCCLYPGQDCVCCLPGVGEPCSFFDFPNYCDHCKPFCDGVFGWCPPGQGR